MGGIPSFADMHANGIRGTWSACARTGIGHVTVAPPIRVMRSRRRTPAMKTTSRTNKILAAAVTGMAIASATGAFAASEQTVSGPARPIYSSMNPPISPGDLVISCTRPVWPGSKARLLLREVRGRSRRPASKPRPLQPKQGNDGFAGLRGSEVLVAIA